MVVARRKPTEVSREILAEAFATARRQRATAIAARETNDPRLQQLLALYWCPVCECHPSVGHHPDCALEKGTVLR